ncbi:MAG: 3-deoxy-7-phosphoheptulonate synthase [Defluviitaleaceae bacterium]|nr:3-deoxy-7-phosphoheptulonate synthase [Defluviitaleaceae bacterium]
MAFKTIRKLPALAEIIAKAPLTADLQKIKDARDAELKAIIEHKSDRFLVIIGPCSADDEDTVTEYVTKLAKVYEKLKDKLFVVPRIYTNKPRTTGEGYKGMMHQPDPTSAPNMADGIAAIRNIHLRCIKETGLTAADEMLYPDNLVYCEDLLGYIAIGARSVENQHHRLTSSGISIPVGLKNPTSGDLNVMFNAIKAAQTAHTFIFRDAEVATTGNPLSHAIMRGSVNRQGEDIPNYHYEDLQQAVELYEKRGLKYPMIVVDANHSNSAKQYQEQPRIAKDILHTRQNNAKIKQVVRGLMIESYLKEGRQDVHGGTYEHGRSITDPCLGWEATEELLHYIAENV